ncbi:hypothetical protein C2857_003184 [Epichloe festucae Fl1]|uniref:Uncharacterized protein n=1 Tax=Epichloe festucae (strain Fl1) TaxID=877507 RepID=A0A7U3Q335_EPIFF|nr:hypothetical protein C2857_003184 [Epichloe festucae Fl1]
MLHKIDMEKKGSISEKRSVRPRSIRSKVYSHIKHKHYDGAGDTELENYRIRSGPPTRSSDVSSVSTNYQASDASGLKTSASTRKTSPAMSFQTHEEPSQHCLKFSKNSVIYQSPDPEFGTFSVRAKKRIKSALE